MTCEAVERDEFRTPVSPQGVRFMQVTSDDRRDSHIGRQNTIRWTRDSKRFVFFREASGGRDARPGIWLCDTEEAFAIRPLREWDEQVLPAFTPLDAHADGLLGTGCQFNPDGSSFYEIHRRKDVLELRRIAIDTRASETVMTAPAPLSCGWMDVSADGEHVALSVFLGDGETEGAPWGIRVFDVREGRTWVVELNNRARRGGRYRKGAGYLQDPGDGRVHDLAVTLGPSQLSDGSWLTPPDGRWRWPNPPGNLAGKGTHVHVIRDDGSDLPGTPGATSRVVPLPQRPLFISSHNCWRGSRAESYVASMYNVTPERWRAPFVEARPVPLPEADRVAERVPVRWTDLTRNLARADACHFDFDASGRHVVSDTDGYVFPLTCMLYVGTVVESEGGGLPWLKTRLLGIPRTSWKSQQAHPHPCLSPDGRYALFQSDFTGRPQVNLAYGFEYP